MYNHHMRSLPPYLLTVLSPTEVNDICTRLKICELLSKGVTYREIIKKTGAGAATIARVAKHLQGSGAIHGSQKKTIKPTLKNQYSFGNHAPTP